MIWMGSESHRSRFEKYRKGFTAIQSPVCRLHLESSVQHLAIERQFLT